MQIASTASMPKIPAEFLTIAALTRSDSEASEMMPPTTGSIPVAAFVAFTAISSELPLTTPVRVI